tara:strand:- start:35679 stop:36809 length:1131 start_codon:yes stop_codon:yes gene_type:complete
VPLKRQLSASSEELIANIKNEMGPDTVMTTAWVEQSPPRSVPEYSEYRYGVFEHYDPEDLTNESANLVHTAADFTTAYNMLHQHAGERIGQRPDWGNTLTQAADNKFEILGHDHEVRLRYEIALVNASGSNAQGKPIWTRVNDKLEEATVDAPPELYIMDIDLDCHAEDTKHFITGAYHSVAEASSAMKAAAHAYLDKHDGARLLERQIELVDEKGVVHQRYSVGPGRYTNNQLMTEEAWLQQQAQNAAHLVTPEPSSPVPEPAINTAAPRPQAAAKAKPKPTAVETQDARIWCTCRHPDDGTFMLGCENDGCPVQWYHGACVGVYEEPDGAWFCPACAPTHAPRQTRRQSVAKKMPKGKTGAAVKKAKGKKRKTG